MIEEREIIEIAERHLSDLSKEIGLELVISFKPKKIDKGYIIFFDSRDWIQNKNYSSALAGNLPFLVNFRTGKIEEIENFKEYYDG